MISLSDELRARILSASFGALLTSLVGKKDILYFILYI